MHCRLAAFTPRGIADYDQTFYIRDARAIEAFNKE